MAEKEQVKPLSPAAGSQFDITADDDVAISRQLNVHRHKYIKCCGCVTAFLLILAVVIIVLTFTIFRIKYPKISIQSLELANGTFGASENMTVLGNMRVKNPNIGSFKFRNSAMTIYYGGSLVGEARIPAGKIKAKRTLQMNITVILISEKLLGVPGFASEFSSGALNLSTYTGIRGKINVINIFKRNVELKVNCTMTYSISSEEVQHEKCRQRFNF